MSPRHWVVGVLASLACAAVIVSCGGTGGGGGHSGGGTGEQFVLNSNNSGHFLLQVDPNQVDANKSDRLGLVATLTDIHGNGVPSVPITFTSDVDDITFIPDQVDAKGNHFGVAFTDASGRADIIAVAGSKPTSTGGIIGTGAIFATAPTGFALFAQVQVTLVDVGFIDSDMFTVIPSQINLGNPAVGTVLFFTVVGGTPPYAIDNGTSGIGTGEFGQHCLPGCTENGGVLCIGSPCQSDSDCNLNGSSTPAGVCLGPIRHCLASCTGNNCAGSSCSTDSDCNNGSATPANVCEDSGQTLAYTVTVGCGDGHADTTDTSGATHLFDVHDAAGDSADITVVVTLAEQCDGSDLAGNTCTTLQGSTFTGGTLACTSACTFDTSGCTNATPAPGATPTPGGGGGGATATRTATPGGGGGGTPTPAGTPGIGIPSNLDLALVTNGSGTNGNGTLTTVIAATVTDSVGNPVPDGTSVVFGLTGATQGAVINSPSQTNADPPCDVSSFESSSQGTGITVFNEPGVAHTCVVYPVASAGAQITIDSVSGAASDSQTFTLPPPPP